MQKNNISLIVTNWNGLNLLKRNFLSVVQNSPEAKEIILADDASTDGSVHYISELQKKYKQIKIIKNQTNLRFGKNSNNAVKSSTGDYIVLLNNDISPHPGYIKNALKHLYNKDVFGVGFSELGNENWARIFWENGYLQHEPGLDVSKTHISAWISGGGCIIKKSYFLQLGGFDDIYHPGYYEDADMGLRAWKSGYRLLWEPTSVIEHHHESTYSKLSKHEMNYVKERNRLLLTWRNIDDKGLLFQNKLAIIGRIILGPNYLKIVRAAKKQVNTHPLPIVFPKIKDTEVLELFKAPSN